METSMASCSRSILLFKVSSQHSSALFPPSFNPKSLKSSSLFGDSLRMTTKSSSKVNKAKNSNSLVTKCELGDSLEEFLSKATKDKGLIRLMMCMGEALRTIAFKVRTASCGGTQCVNTFGDEQLAVDVLADKLLFEALNYSHFCKYACSEEVPSLQDMGGPTEGGFSVAFDPLDGSSIVDTNFSVGTIFGVWPGDKLTGVTGRDQVAAAMGIYGPRTTYVLALKDYPGTHEFLLLDEGKWLHLVQYYVREKYTLRYTGGMVPDVNQVAPLGLLIEKAGGYSSDGAQSVLDKVINNLDDRTQVAYGSKNEIIRFEKTLYGSSKLEEPVPVGAAA
ncbi:Sedoheptulose-1 7-bisphosphatase chloroplastic [Bienertia sinuspersici]